MRWISAALALPLGVTALRYRNGANPEEALNLRMSSNYGTDDVHEFDMDDSSTWPDQWWDATAHGRFVAHQLDNHTLYNFLHGEGGEYQGQTLEIPEWDVPALKMAHAISGFKPRTPKQVHKVTNFPSYLALASSWDPFMVGEVATAVAQEFKTLGANVMLGPALNVHRATQHDEDFDSLSGEDPTLGSVMARYWTLNVHNEGIMTVPKYLGKTEQGPLHYRNVSANITAWDIFYPPFETAVDCGASGVMCDAHEVDGVWACRDSELLQRDLKDIMGFKGMVVADTGSAKDFFPARSSFELGTDLVLDEPVKLPPSDHMIEGMKEAASRVLASIWRLRLNGDKGQGGCKPPCKKELLRDARSEAHSLIAKKAAGSGVTLLKNDGEILPITPDKYTKIAVLGPAAFALGTNGDSTEGDYYTGPSFEHISGFNYLPPGVGLWSWAGTKGMNVTNQTQGADICVVMAGSKLYADHWKLDEESLAAVNQAVAECSKVVVLMEIMGAVLMPWRSQVGAIASMFHSGEETATAWAATILGGEFSPSGKLPISFPKAGQEMEQWWRQPLPSYWDPNFEAIYPFGHGLSYASFVYSDLKDKPKCRFVMCLQVTVLNNSTKYSGAEVVQVYFKYKSETQHPTVLKGFYKTDVLKPGKSEKVFFHFSYRDICLFHARDGVTEKEKSWVPQDDIEVLVGASSQDIRGSLTMKPRIY